MHVYTLNLSPNESWAMMFHKPLFTVTAHFLEFTVCYGLRSIPRSM